MFLYNIGIGPMEWGIKVSGLWNAKNRLWADGRKNLISRIREEIRPEDRIFWVHAASVGEFEQGRPIIEYVKEHHPEYKIVLTFYSPSGYELRKNYSGADHIYYFPSDKASVVKAFLDAIHPEIAVFVKYEFWLNTLLELKRRGVRTFLVSAIFQPDSIFFKAIGGSWRKALGCFETLFVQDARSRALLESINVGNSVIAGDTRFDRVMQICKNAKQIELAEKFRDGKKVFVAGSTWGPDEDILIRLINDNPDTKFIIAPHEMDEGRIGRLMREVKGWATRYTCPDEDIAKRQVLIIDTIGLLSSLYRYADWAYIGGGFGTGIHNTVEAAVYGLPLAFGPKYRKFNEAVAMVGKGIAVSVGSYEELSAWFTPLKNNEESRQQICKAAKDYTSSQLGATDIIIQTIGL